MKRTTAVPGAATKHHTGGTSSDVNGMDFTRDENLDLVTLGCSTVFPDHDVCNMEVR